MALLIGAWLALLVQVANATDLAVIVHPANPTTDVSLRDVRAYLRLDRVLWPDGRPVDVWLRAGDGPEARILLSVVYHTDAAGLRRFWVERLYRGEITAVPSVVPTAALAGARVAKSPGALSVVLAEEVPAGVRVLRVDGHLPGEPGYPLTGP